MSEIRVNSVKGTGASTAAITIDSSSGGFSGNITNRPNRNLIINGAFQIAQRGTSSTTSGLATVDRFQQIHSGTDEAPTQSQVDVASGTTPYSLGFRKAFKITNGNQTSGAGADDFIWIQTKLEAQDVANSGWNYISTSSYITLSFWVKSSVAQDFKGYLRSRDGTERMYPFATGSLTADTWTKVTKTISGNSGLQFDNNANEGLQLNIGCFFGTNLTNNSTTENAWATWDSAARSKDFTSTWYTTNDATFEITGVQLEVSPIATDFEFKSRGQELALCQRYYFSFKGDDDEHIVFGYAAGGGFCNFIVPYPVPMRAAPTYTGSATAARFYNNSQSADFNLSSLSLANMETNSVEPKHGAIFITTTSGMVTGNGGSLALNEDNGILEFSAEL